MSLEREFLTEGERLAGRSLAKEKRAGVKHYVPGQWDVRLHVGGEDFFSHDSVDIARITYVDATGHLCVVLTMRSPSLTGRWRATWVSRAGQHFRSDPRRIDTAEEFPLSGRMLALLAEAAPSPWPSAAAPDGGVEMSRAWAVLMGDDGTGHCRGCGRPLDRIDPSCPVCFRALEALAPPPLSSRDPGDETEAP